MLICVNAITFNLIFSKVIRNTDIIQTILKNKGGNPKLIAVLLEKHYYDTIDNLGSYENDYSWYSEIGNRKICEKIVVLDRALEYCSKDNRTLLDNTDIFLAAMDEYERCLNEDKSTWTDKELNKEYVTLSHVCGRYDENLWIKFDDIREGLKKSKENVEVA